MKKIIILQTILLLISLHTFSQNKFKGGLIVGINGSQIDGDSMSGFDKGGLLAGVFIDFPLSAKTYLSMELLYSMKGSKQKDQNSANYIYGPWYMLRLTYIDVPLLLNYKIREKVMINGGIACGILVGSKYLDHDRMEEPRFDAIRAYDFLPVIGLKLQLTKNLYFFSRYSYSAFNIGKDKSNMLWSRTNRGLHNNVVTGGVRFYINPKNK